ncbi:MAG: hypothetical protein SFX73_16010 [Kofleriaceae bacterium]|nr:hypothetical protein [Kofleriaceae bacterium]
MRNTTSSILALMIAVATGCAAQAPGTPGDDDDDDMENPEDLPVPTSPEGRFNVQSTFDIATNLPGTAGTVANYFIQATDDPDDPTKFIVEQILNALPDGSVKNTLQGSVPLVAGYLNDKLLEVAPNFIDKIVDIGDAFGQVAKNFGTNELVEITSGGRGTKTVTGLHFVVDNVDIDLPFADFNIEPIKVENIMVTLNDRGRLDFAQHVVPMKYGQVMKLALDYAIIPMIDPAASGLEDILKSVVNCQAVGQYVFEKINVGSASTFESACNTGLTLAANTLYNQLNNIDTAALEFNLTGQARGIDRNNDSKMDEIQTGVWTGDLKYSGSPAPLSMAKFHGSKTN